MATKVKGDKIKEGSIPLSALDSNIQNDLSYVGTISPENPVLILPQAFAEYYIEQIYSIQPYSEIQVADLKVKYSVENSIGKLTANYSDASFKGAIKISKSRDIRRYELPPSLADWNAQEGEAGYVKNRTHGIRWYNKPEDSNFNNLLLGLKNKTPEITIEDSFTKATYKQVNELEDMALNGFKFFEKNWSYDTPYDYVYRFTDNFAIFTGTYGSFDVGWDDNDDIYITIQWNNEEEIKDVNIILNGIDDYYYVIDATNFEISTLDSAYIPNTVIKTTPQTLHTSNKNQALANLGIDPVVWKYLCNPFIIYAKQNNTVPDDLRSIIDEGGSLNLNPLILKLIVVKFEGEDAKIYNISAMDVYSVYYHDDNGLGDIVYADGEFIWV